MGFLYLLLTSLYHFVNIEQKMLNIRRIKHTDPKTKMSQDKTLLTEFIWYNVD